MSNEEVIKHFLNKEDGGGSSCLSRGTRLFSYQTCIAEWWEGKLLVNSSSTEKVEFKKLEKHRKMLKDLIKQNFLMPTIIKGDMDEIKKVKYLHPFLNK